MSARVVDCRGQRPSLTPRPSSPQPQPEAVPPRPFGRPRGQALVILVGTVLVLLAWLTGGPAATAGAAATLVSVLALFRVMGRHARWGWLTLLASGCLLVVPPRETSTLGPVLFTASVLFLALWLANRDPIVPYSRIDTISPYPSHEREAQLLQGMYGEIQVGEVLARELTGEFVVVNGLKLPRGAGDIDHLVVGPPGVFLIETKTMAGLVVCEPDGTWHRSRRSRGGVFYPAYIGDPAAQVDRNARAVRACLRARLPRLFRGLPPEVQGLIVFPHPRTELSVEHSRVPAVRLDAAAAWIQGREPTRRLEPAEVDALVEALLAESETDAQAPKVPHAQGAQALVELALTLPLVLGIAVGVVTISRVVQAHTSVTTVAHESARAASLAFDPREAERLATDRARVVAANLRLSEPQLTIEPDTSKFGLADGRVRVRAAYRLDLSPAPPLVLSAEHVEWIDPHRSGVLGAGVDR